MRADTENWIATAEYDLVTAQHMLATGRYLYVVFCCHLALEKMLKAHIAEVTQTIPPKTHDLGRLISIVSLQVPPAYLTFMGQIDSASLPARYPSDLARVVQNYPEPITREYLRQTTEILEWLKQHPNLTPSSGGSGTS
jgi:HEPN domain-containing protein